MIIRSADAVREFSTAAEAPEDGITYQALYINPDPSRLKNCILILSGTSIQIADIEPVIAHLQERQYAVAAIERRIGYFFHVRIDPKSERKAALTHFLRYLKTDCGMENIFIIAQSYASFEVVRALMDDPETVRTRVSGILFVNPAGFAPRLRFVPHCLRFLFVHMLSEYVRAVGVVIRDTRKIRALNSFFVKTLQNPVRTFREIADIVSFDITSSVEMLAETYGFAFYFALNMDDNLVDASRTLAFARSRVPRDRILTFRGNHLDSFIDERQIRSIADLIGAMDQRGRHA